MEQVSDHGRDAAAALEEEKDSYTAPSQSSLDPQTDQLDLGRSADANLLAQLEDIFSRVVSHVTDAEADGVSQIMLRLRQGTTELDQRKEQLDKREEQLDKREIDILEREAQQNGQALLDGRNQEEVLRKLAQLDVTRIAFEDKCSQAKAALDHDKVEFEIRRQTLSRGESDLIRRQQTVLAREMALDNVQEEVLKRLNNQEEVIKRLNENISRAVRRMREFVATRPRDIATQVELLVCFRYIFGELGRDGTGDSGSAAVSGATANPEGKARSDGDRDLHLSTLGVQDADCGAQGRYELDIDNDVPVEGARFFNENQSAEHNRSDSRTRGQPTREQQYRSLEQDLRQELVELREAVPDDEMCAWRMKQRIEDVKMKLNAGTEDCGYADRFETDVSDAETDDTFDYNCLTEDQFKAVELVREYTNCSQAQSRELLSLADWNVRVAIGPLRVEAPEASLARQNALQITEPTLGLTNCLLSEQRRKMHEFMEVTQRNEGAAIGLLTRAAWDVELAIRTYWEEGLDDVADYDEDDSDGSDPLMHYEAEFDEDESVGGTSLDEDDAEFDADNAGPWGLGLYM